MGYSPSHNFKMSVFIPTLVYILKSFYCSPFLLNEIYAKYYIPTHTFFHVFPNEELLIQFIIKAINLTSPLVHKMSKSVDCFI